MINFKNDFKTKFKLDFKKALFKTVDFITLIFLIEAFSCFLKAELF